MWDNGLYCGILRYFQDHWLFNHRCRNSSLICRCSWKRQLKKKIWGAADFRQLSGEHLGIESSESMIAIDSERSKMKQSNLWSCTVRHFLWNWQLLGPLARPKSMPPPWTRQHGVRSPQSTKRRQQNQQNQQNHKAMLEAMLEAMLDNLQFLSFYQQH